MRLLLYEFATGGGLIGVPTGASSQTLEREGAAMISALAADFASSNQHCVQVVRDARLKELLFPGCEVLDVSLAGDDRNLLGRHAPAADWTLIIAPESAGVLFDRCKIVGDAGGRLLGPTLEFIALAGDKHRTAQWLLERGIAAPRGCALPPGTALSTPAALSSRSARDADFHYPAVLKPRDGCGSQGVRLIADDSAAQAIGIVAASSRVEEFCAGEAASITLLCGPGIRHALPPCRQLLSQDGRFSYLGGSTPIPRHLAERATLLSLKVARALPPLIGYLGLDLILGASTDGSDDRVIEINPRLTTSYVGLRAACHQNLAEALLQVVSGSTPAIDFRADSLCFSASGEIKFTMPGLV